MTYSFLYHPSPPTIGLTPIWSTFFTRSFPHMHKPPKARFYHFFHKKCHTPMLSLMNSFLRVYCLMCPTYASQHSHFCNTEILFSLAFNVRHSIPHNIIGLTVVWSKISLKLEWYFFIANKITHEAHLHCIHPTWILWFTSSISSLFIWSTQRYLNDLWYDTVSNFHL